MSTPVLSRFSIQSRFHDERAYALKATNLEDALSEVAYDYANTGQRVILERRYILLETVKHKVDTDYK